MVDVVGQLTDVLTCVIGRPITPSTLLLPSMAFSCRIHVACAPSRSRLVRRERFEESLKTSSDTCELEIVCYGKEDSGAAPVPVTPKLWVSLKR
jgi:hypothetical protein